MDVENLRDFGHRLDDKAIEAKGIIEAIFDATIKAKDGSKSLTSEGVFKLIAGQVFLQYLKEKESTVYNNIVNDLDVTWSAGEIAIKAMSYSDRLLSDNAEYQAKTPATFNAAYKGQVKASEQPCYNYLRGKCTNRGGCRYKHDAELLKVFESEKEKCSHSGGAISSDENKKKRSGNWKNKKKSDQSHSTSSTHTASVALPTQRGFQ